MDMFSFTKEDLEEILDQAKASVLLDLVYEGLLYFDSAERYSSVKTIVLKKKGFFRTITNRWSKTDDVKGHVMIVVGNDHIDNTISEPPKEGGKLISILDKVKRGIDSDDDGTDPTDSG